MKKEKILNDLEYDVICEFVKLRKDLGVTQSEMAKSAGTTREMISVIENGKRHTRINTIIKLIEPYGYTLSITKIKP